MPHDYRKLAVWDADEFNEWGLALFAKKRVELGGSPLFPTYESLAEILLKDIEFMKDQKVTTTKTPIITPKQWLKQLAKGLQIPKGLTEAVMRAIEQEFSSRPKFLAKLRREFALLPPTHIRAADDKTVRRPNISMIRRPYPLTA